MKHINSLNQSALQDKSRLIKFKSDNVQDTSGAPSFWDWHNNMDEIKHQQLGGYEKLAHFIMTKKELMEMDNVININHFTDLKHFPGWHGPVIQ